MSRKTLRNSFGRRGYPIQMFGSFTYSKFALIATRFVEPKRRLTPSVTKCLFTVKNVCHVCVLAHLRLKM